jgi:DNA-directed RNA polymerase subunit beta'
LKGGEVIQPIGERILGRIALEDIVDPYSEEVIVCAGERSHRIHSKCRLKITGIEMVKIRSVTDL